MASCATDINRVKKSSPLFEAVKLHPPGEYHEKEITKAILQQLPRGATRQKIEAFIATNFDGARYEVMNTAGAHALYHPKDPYVLIRAIDSASWAGRESVEIYLILTPDEHLKDIFVRSERAYL